MMTTTTNQPSDGPWAVTMADIYAQRPCTDGWQKLRKFTGLSADDATTPVTLLTIFESNGLDDALWCLRTVKGRDREIQLYAVWCARQVQHLMIDPHSVAAIDVAERYAHGEATAGELASARDAAWASAGASARDAARDAVRDAVRDASWATAWDASWDASRASAWDAAWDASRDAQEAKFKEMVS